MDMLILPIRLRGLNTRVPSRALGERWAPGHQRGYIRPLCRSRWGGGGLEKTLRAAAP